MTMASNQKRKLPKPDERPDWYDELTPQAKAEYDATDWSKGWSPEGQTVVIPVPKPKRP
jgi:hypothetical protein